MSIPTTLSWLLRLSFTKKKLCFSRLDKKFKVPATIQTWGVAIYESSRRFSPPILQEMITSFQKACARVGKHWLGIFELPISHLLKKQLPGINIVNSEPVTRYITNPQGVIETVIIISHWASARIMTSTWWNAAASSALGVCFGSCRQRANIGPAQIGNRFRKSYSDFIWVPCYQPPQPRVHLFLSSRSKWQMLLV